MASPSSFEPFNGTQPHRNNFSSLKSPSRLKTGSEQKQNGSSGAVRLGDYVRQREFSREKQIAGQVKSSQLVAVEDPTAKQLKFKRQNVNRLYDKIAIEINRRRVELSAKTQDQLEKEESFMEEVLKMIVGTKPGDLYTKQSSSTQTSTVSTAPYNISKKYNNHTFLENETGIKGDSQRQHFKYKSNERVLDDSITKGDRMADRIESLLDRYRNKDRSEERGIGGREGNVKGLGSVEKKLTSSVHNLRMMRPPPMPKK